MTPKRMPTNTDNKYSVFLFIQPTEKPIAKVNGIKVKPTVSCPIENPAIKLNT